MWSPALSCCTTGIDSFPLSNTPGSPIPCNCVSAAPSRTTNQTASVEVQTRMTECWTCAFRVPPHRPPKAAPSCRCPLTADWPARNQLTQRQLGTRQRNFLSNLSKCRKAIFLQNQSGYQIILKLGQNAT